MVSARISWDEENDPKPFLYCWAASQISFIIAGILIKSHVFKTIGLLGPGSSSGERAFGILAYGLLMVALTLYLNLIMNGFMHRNPDIADTDDREVEGDVDDSLSSLSIKQRDEAQEQPSVSPGLFERSLLKNPDPVVLRDAVQWKRMILATSCVGILFVTLALLS